MKINLIQGKFCNTYFIEDDVNIVIDAGAELVQLLKVIGDKKVDIVFLTHAHYDHFAYLDDYLKKFDNAIVYMSKKAYEKMDDNKMTCAMFFTAKKINKINKSKVKFINEGDIINELKTQNNFINLEGHTDCSMGLIVADNLFCGDAIFEYGYGRFDLPTGSKDKTNLTLQKIKNLDNIDMVYAGHGNIFKKN